MFTPRLLAAFGLCGVSVLLALFSLSAKDVRHPDTRHTISKLRQRPAMLRPNVIDGGPETMLAGVTCVSSNDCWAVGNYWTGSSYQTLIEHWNGVGWSFVASPETGANSGLDAVSCLSTSDCWAAGSYYNNATARPETLIEHWNGSSWSTVSSPNATTTEQNTLGAITCNSASDCWAVGKFGSFFTAPYQRTLIEHWDGAAWSIVNSPNGSTTLGNELRSVTCTSPSNCWAVGIVGVSYVAGPWPNYGLIEHWDGNSWSIINPFGQNAYNALNGVTCISPTQCWAAGYYHWDSNADPFFARWDGSSWISYPGVHYTYGSLCNVTCLSGSDCWAVGDCDHTDSSVFVQHWNGTQWSTVAAPDPAPGSSQLTSVTCPSANDCWAVGWDVAQGALMEHWDGQSWSIFSMPPQVTGVVSRKAHGGAGTFDVDLLTGDARIECRSGGANADYQMVFTFQNDLVRVGSATSFDATVAGGLIGPGSNQYTVNLTGVPNQGNVTVTLNLAQDTAGSLGNASAEMPVLIGDTSGDGIVNGGDVIQTRGRAGQATDVTNFRSDVNLDGIVNSGDALVVRSRSGNSLP